MSDEQSASTSTPITDRVTRSASKKTSETPNDNDPASTPSIAKKRKRMSDGQALIIVPEGPGTKLGEIETIAENLATADAKVTKDLHKFLFGKIGDPINVVENLKKFNGFDFDADSSEYVKKYAVAGRMPVAAVREFLELLGLSWDKKVKKDVAVKLLMRFLLSPGFSADEPLPAGPVSPANATDSTMGEDVDRTAKGENGASAASEIDLSSGEVIADEEQLVDASYVPPEFIGAFGACAPDGNSRTAAEPAKEVGTLEPAGVTEGRASMPESVVPNTDKTDGISDATQSVETAAALPEPIEASEAFKPADSPVEPERVAETGTDVVAMAGTNGASVDVEPTTVDQPNGDQVENVAQNEIILNAEKLLKEALEKIEKMPFSPSDELLPSAFEEEPMSPKENESTVTIPNESVEKKQEDLEDGQSKSTEPLPGSVLEEIVAAEITLTDTVANEPTAVAEDSNDVASALMPDTE